MLVVEQKMCEIQRKFIQESRCNVHVLFKSVGELEASSDGDERELDRGGSPILPIGWKSSLKYCDWGYCRKL